MLWSAQLRPSVQLAAFFGCLPVCIRERCASFRERGCAAGVQGIVQLLSWTHVLVYNSCGDVAGGVQQQAAGGIGRAGSFHLLPLQRVRYPWCVA